MLVSNQVALPPPRQEPAKTHSGKNMCFLQSGQCSKRSRSKVATGNSTQPKKRAPRQSKTTSKKTSQRSRPTRAKLSIEPKFQDQDLNASSQSLSPTTRSGKGNTSHNHANEQFSASPFIPNFIIPTCITVPFSKPVIGQEQVTNLSSITSIGFLSNPNVFEFFLFFDLVFFTH